MLILHGHIRFEIIKLKVNVPLNYQSNIRIIFIDLLHNYIQTALWPEVHYYHVLFRCFHTRGYLKSHYFSNRSIYRTSYRHYHPVYFDESINLLVCRYSILQFTLIFYIIFWQFSSPFVVVIDLSIRLSEYIISYVGISAIKNLRVEYQSLIKNYQ